MIRLLKILVADDENLIRKGIIAILRRALDADIEYLEAGDGIEALSTYNEHKPGIVITDIRMPRMSGLELIGKITENGNPPCFIILSGYAEFEYARTAISMGVREYILKPVNKQELITVTEKFVKMIAESEQQARMESARGEANEKVARALKQELFIELLNCGSADETGGLLKKLSELGVNFKCPLLSGVIVQYRVNDENKSFIDFAVKNILDELISQETGFDCVFNVQYESGRLAAVMEGNEREVLMNAVKALLSKACSLIYRHLNTEAFAGIGEIVYGSQSVFKSFRSALMAANYKIFSPGISIAAFSELRLGTSSRPVRFEDLAESLENMNSAGIAARFDSLLQQAPSVSLLQAAEQSYSGLVDTIRGNMVRYNFARTDCSIAPAPFYMLWSLTQLKMEVIRYTEQVQECACEAGIDVSNKKLIVDVLRYVKENAAKDINLNSVAEHFSRTPAYMSALFKKGAGEGFNLYLTGIRMDMAKVMLADSSIPIGEVGSLCGYPNPKYFSVVFKKMFGMSPAAYRQNYLV